MGEYLRLELCSRYVHLRNLSLRVAEVDASRRLLAGGEAIAEMLFSRSDSAKSCSMISPFSHFSALLGSPSHVFANIANTARAVTAPMNRMLIIYAAFLACVVKAVVQAGNVRLLELRDVGYQGCCPETLDSGRELLQKAKTGWF
jgi:hypothetical protein